MKATLYVFERRSDCLGHVKFTAEFLHLITLPMPDQSVLIYSITHPITSMTYMYIIDEDCRDTRTFTDNKLLYIDRMFRQYGSGQLGEHGTS